MLVNRVRDVSSVCVTYVSCGYADSGNIVRAYTSTYGPEVSIRTSK